MWNKVGSIVGIIFTIILGLIGVMTFTGSRVGEVDKRLSSRIEHIAVKQQDSNSMISKLNTDITWVRDSLIRIERKIDAK